MQAQNNPIHCFEDLLRDFTPWQNEKNPSYPLNRYTLRRNVSGFLFSEKLSLPDGLALTDKFEKALSKIFPNGLFFSSKDLNNHSTHLLFEHLFIANRDNLHPGGGVFIDINTNFIAIFLLEDHLTLFFHDSNKNDLEMLQTIKAVDEALEKATPFAFCDQFGYITCQAVNLGTALTKEAIFHTPCINILDADIKKSPKVLIHGLGSEKNTLHNLVIVTNKYSLGISEKNILSSVEETANDIFSKEHSSLEHLKASRPSDLINTLSKNFGLVTFCKSLEFFEALSIASSIDLAISLGLITSISKTFFFDMFFSLRRAHIEAFFSKDTIPLEEKRALLFKEKIKDLKIHI
jgi:protein arginine kinase